MNWLKTILCRFKRGSPVEEHATSNLRTAFDRLDQYCGTLVQRIYDLEYENTKIKEEYDKMMGRRE